MSDIKIKNKAAAAAFLHALKHSSDVREKWVSKFSGKKSDKDWSDGDRKELCKLIAETVGLAETPEIKDLHEMHAHASVELKEQSEELEAMDTRISAKYCVNGMDGG
jgi:hypothetical protein